MGEKKSAHCGTSGQESNGGSEKESLGTNSSVFAQKIQCNIVDSCHNTCELKLSHSHRAV